MSIASFIWTETSPAAPGTAASSVAVAGAGAAFGVGIAGPLDDYEALSITAELVGATGGTLDVYTQVSPDQGVTWFDYLHFPQLLNGASAIKYASPSSMYTQSQAATVIGKNLTPALAANTTTNGAFTDRMRILMVAGSGTSVGAAVKITMAAQRVYPRP